MRGYWRSNPNSEPRARPRGRVPSAAGFAGRRSGLTSPGPGGSGFPVSRVLPGGNPWCRMAEAQGQSFLAEKCFCPAVTLWRVAQTHTHDVMTEDLSWAQNRQRSTCELWRNVEPSGPDVCDEQRANTHLLSRDPRRAGRAPAGQPPSLPVRDESRRAFTGPRAGTTWPECGARR